jgi:predicted GH43/DUF377 family glycosyl hydrolase
VTLVEHLQILAIHCYYTGDNATGRRACERALAMSLTDSQENQIRTNRTWYTQTLDELVECRWHPIDVPVKAGYTQFNPSIVATDDGWLVNVRSSNYRIRNWGYVIPPEDGQFIRTHNHLVRLNDEIEVVSADKLEVEYPKTNFFADGLEDIRLNQVDGELIFSVTLRNHAPWDGLCRITVGKIDQNRVVGLQVLDSPRKQHEKNWMPFTGQKRWLYGFDVDGQAAIVGQDDNGKWYLEKTVDTPLIARKFRGGSQLVEVKPDQWLGVIHEVAMNGGHRVYEHRFVLVDGQGKLLSYSPVFVFKTKFSIEFAAGLAVKGDRVLVSFGEMDETACIVECALGEVFNILERVGCT